NAADPGAPPVIVSANDGFLVTSTGAIINATTQTTVFTSAVGSEVRFVEAFQTGAGAPDLFALEADGRLVRLTSPTGDAYSEAQVLADTGLTDLSTLQVVGQGESLELYVTEAGSDLPLVFPFEIGQGGGGPGEGLGSFPEEPAVAGLTPVGEFNLSF